MSRFIQSLESRTLFSAGPVDKPTLLADEALVVADGAAARADLRSLAAVVRTDTAKIQVDLRGLPKTNLPLMRTLRVDEARLLAQTTVDLNMLLNPATALSRQSTAAGVLLLTKATLGLQARVGADVTALGNVTVAPLAKFQADFQDTAINTDLQALLDANPSATTLSTDAGQMMTDTSADADTLNTAVSAFATDVGALGADLSSALSNSSLLPTVTGTYTGSATATAGKNIGRVSTLSVVITSEGTDGSLSGSLTITNPGQGPQTQVLTGSVSAAGVFTATVSDPSDPTNGATLTGHVVGSTISGTYASTGDSGTFTIHK